MKKMLIVGVHQPWIDLYQAACQQAGIVVMVMNPTQAVLTAGRHLSVQHAGRQLGNDFDYIIPLEEDFEDIYYSLAIDKQFGSTNMLNKSSLLRYPQFSHKFHQYQIIGQHSELLTPISHFSVNTSLLSEQAKPYESIAKLVKSSRGRGVFELPDQDALIQLADEYGKRLLVQDYIPTDPVHSYRTLILDSTSLGTVKSLSSGRLTTNGATTTVQVEEPAFVAELEMAAHNIGLDFCGIDYVVQDGRPVLFEINRFPYFGGFTKATGRDVAAEVIAFLRQLPVPPASRS